MKRNSNTKTDVGMLPDSPSKHKYFFPQNTNINVEEIINTNKSNGRLKKKSRSGYLREFTDNTSLHGLKYLGEKNISIVHKIWWSVMIILSITVCGYLIQSLWKKWILSPVIVSFAETYTPNWQIPFPAITVCSPIKFNKSDHNFTEKCSKDNLTESEILNFRAISIICGDNCLEDNHTFVNESTVNRIMEIAPKFREVILGCIWDSEEYCSNIFHPILTDDGLCYTANMLNTKEIYKHDVLKYNSNSSNYTNEGWDSDTGYDENLPQKTYPRRGIGNGMRSSMMIVITHDSKNLDFKCAGLYSGFKIVMHPPNIIPRLSQQFNWVPIEIEASFAIKPRMMTTSMALKKYKPKERMCYFANEKYLSFFRNYTQENCELECLTNYTLAECGCASYYMPRYATTPICSLEMLECSTQAIEDIHVRRILSIKTDEDANPYRSEKGLKVAMACDCLPSCTTISYDVEMTQTALEWKQYLNSINMSYSLSYENSSVRLGIVKVYFKEPHFITTKRSELYGLIDFLANCGGLLGVCLGFSILSLFEIIYFITIRLFSQYRANTKKIKSSQA